jgi:lysyl-tRNA synthetase class 2
MTNPCLSTAPIANLRKRAELTRALREFFDARGFIEVHTPILSRYCVIDRHLDPIRVPAQSVGLSLHDESNTQKYANASEEFWYLQTSPEQSMKRLLASGLGSCYQLGPVFRSAEFGQVHNPEFSMAEWYDLNADFEQGLILLDDLLQVLLNTQPAKRVRFADAFDEATQLPLFDTSVDDLAEWSVRRGLVDKQTWSDDWDDWVNLIFSLVVQPTLGLPTSVPPTSGQPTSGQPTSGQPTSEQSSKQRSTDGVGRPVLVTHFPASQAALAKLDPTDTRTAERYEIFYRGVELANGYHELLNPDELAKRARIANQQRVADGKFPLPEENPLIEAMRIGFPSCCGCALGFDRVVMLACNATSLRDVIPFPADIA